MKNFINLKDIPARDLRRILDDAKKRKNKRKKLNTLDVDKDKPLKGKLIIQMYEKQSSRTRLSFHLSIAQLGGGTITIKANELHLGKGGETLADTAKILSTYGDGFMLRTDSDKKIEEFTKNLTIPTINLLSPSSHPCQVLSDIFTVEEVKKGAKGADCILTINNKDQEKLAQIYFESKDHKTFKEEWVSKLLSDMKDKNINYGVLITTAMPKDYNKQHDGYVERHGKRIIIIPMNYPIIHMLVSFIKTNLINEHKSKKDFDAPKMMKRLWDHIMGPSFNYQ